MSSESELNLEFGVPKELVYNISEIWRLKNVSELAMIMKVLELINLFLMSISNENREKAKQIIKQYAESL